MHAEYENSKQRVYIKGQKYWTATEQLQSEARVARTGQTSTPIIFDIVVEDICELTIDSRQNSQHLMILQVVIHRTSLYELHSLNVNTQFVSTPMFVRNLWPSLGRYFFKEHDSGHERNNTTNTS